MGEGEVRRVTPTLYVLAVLTLTALSLYGLAQQVATRKQRQQARAAAYKYHKQQIQRGQR